MASFLAGDGGIRNTNAIYRFPAVREPPPRQSIFDECEEFRLDRKDVSAAWLADWITFGRNYFEQGVSRRSPDRRRRCTQTSADCARCFAGV
jgi:hypothetical protein